jgi:hypothetical protein
LIAGFAPPVLNTATGTFAERTGLDLASYVAGKQLIYQGGFTGFLGAVSAGTMGFVSPSLYLSANASLSNKSQASQAGLSNQQESALQSLESGLSYDTSSILNSPFSYLRFVGGGALQGLEYGTTYGGFFEAGTVVAGKAAGTIATGVTNAMTPFVEQTGTAGRILGGEASSFALVQDILQFPAEHPLITKALIGGGFGVSATASYLEQGYPLAASLAGGGVAAFAPYFLASAFHPEQVAKGRISRASLRFRDSQ